MECPRNNVITNSRGIPYFNQSTVTVTDTAVNIALGYFYNFPAVGYFTIRVTIPEGTSGTLPVNIVLNRNSRALTLFNGVPVTAANITGTGVIQVFNDSGNNILQLVSPPVATT